MRMKATAAIKLCLNTPGNRPDMVYQPVSVQEIKELKDACSIDEWQMLGRQACTALGLAIEE